MNDIIEFPTKGAALLQSKTVTAEMVSSREAHEVQAAMVVAKKFPRNQQEAWLRIENACRRKSLAEQAIYTYPRGGAKVEGPSIRLAECLAQAWGNIDFGIVELEQRDGESVVMSYAWDLETNTRQRKIFQVPHIRKTKAGTTKLDDPRDIYEMIANQGARRLRACILGVIPGDVVESALEVCNQTMSGSSKEPLVDRVKKMVSAFAELGVTIGMIERRLGHKLDATSESELVTLRKIYTSLKDGMSNREDWFTLDAPKAVVATKEALSEAAPDDLEYGPTAPAKPAKPPKFQPKAAAEPAPAESKPAPAESPVAALRSFVESNGFTFEELVEAAAGLGLLTGPCKSWDDFPSSAASIMAKSPKGLEANLKMARDIRASESK